LKPQPGTSFSTISRQTIWQIIGVIIILVIIGGYTYYSKIYVTAKSTNGSNIQTAIARRGNLVLSAGGTGTLIANSEASFGFETSGQVTQVYVKVGDQVETGQVLAQLDDTLAQMKYDEAQRSLNELYSAASIAAIQLEIATAQDARVAARDWLGYLISPEVLDTEENLAAAQQKLADAQAAAQANPSDDANKAVAENEKAVAYLRDKYSQAMTYYKNVYLPEKFGKYENVGSRRHPKLVLATYIDPTTGEEVPEIKGPSEADLAKARNDYAQAKETISEGEAYLDALKTGVIPDGATGAKLTTLYNAQQVVKNAKSALDATKLIAPISGTVTSLNMNVGERAGASSVITISQLDQPYVVDAYLDETDWNSAKIGNKVSITFDLLPDQTFPGTVTTVYPGLVTSNPALVHICIQLDKSISQSLPAGTGASISVVGGEANNVVLVPVNAIHKTANGYTITVIQNGQKMERDVVIGIRNETYVEIKSGLDAGETVVTG
jgi:RND family efflux transporter MFP subunit